MVKPVFLCSASTWVTSHRVQPAPVCGLVGLLGRTFASGFMLTASCPLPLTVLSMWVVDPYRPCLLAICGSLWVSSRTQNPWRGALKRERETFKLVVQIVQMAWTELLLALAVVDCGDRVGRAAGGPGFAHQ